MRSSSTRAGTRRRLAVLALAALVLGAFTVLSTQTAASAHETHVQLKMHCALTNMELPIDYTVTHTPDTAVAGEVFEITTKASPQLNPAVASIGVKSITITIPAPAGVAGTGDITVTGGNLTKASQAMDGASAVLKLQAAAGVTVGTLDMPTLTIPVEIAEETPATIEFQGPSKLELEIDLAGTLAVETCTALAGNPPLVSTQPTGGTIVETTTTTSAPDTTEPGGEDEGDDTGEDGTGSDSGSGSDDGSGPTPVVANPRYTG